MKAISHRPGLGPWMIVLLFPMVIAGCATTQTTPTSPDPIQRQAPPLEAFDRWVGEYAQAAPNRLSLTIERLPSADGMSHRYQLVQKVADQSSAPRQFMVELGAMSQGIESRFSVLSNNAQTMSCAMSWQVVANDAGQNALFGTTSVDTCQFSNQNQRLGLLKEFSFDGQTLSIADQVIDLETNRAHVPAQVTSFHRIIEFGGWLAKADGDEWRVAEEIRIPSDGQRRAIEDAADMPLGVAISIERRVMEGQLRWVMVLSDAAGDEVIGQAWTSEDATHIGWADDRFQVELSRAP